VSKKLVIIQFKIVFHKEEALFFTIVVVLLFNILLNEKAFSFYVDPGSSSYLFQIIAAILLSAVFYFKNILNIIKEFFFRLSNKG
jgi:hypothetical protein